jgi:hypothetical protein
MHRNLVLDAFGLKRTPYDHITALFNPQPYALVVDGKALASCLRPETQHLFLEVALR